MLARTTTYSASLLLRSANSSLLMCGVTVDKIVIVVCIIVQNYSPSPFFNKCGCEYGVGCPMS